MVQIALSTTAVEEVIGTEGVTVHMLPPAALVGRVDSKDVQFFFVLLWVQAQEVLPVFVQVVDQVPVEAVLCDDVDRAWEQQNKVAPRRQSAG